MALYADMSGFLDSICDDNSTTHIHMSENIVNLGLALNMYLKLQGRVHSHHMDAGNTFTTETWCKFMKELLEHVYLPKDLKQMVSRARALNIRWEDFVTLDEHKTVEAKVQFLYSLGDRAVNMFIRPAPRVRLGHQYLGDERDIDLSSDSDDEQEYDYDDEQKYDYDDEHKYDYYDEHKYDPDDGHVQQPDFQLDRVVQVEQRSSRHGRGKIFKGLLAGVIIIIFLSFLMTMSPPILPEQDQVRCPARTVTWETVKDNCQCKIPPSRLNRHDKKLRRKTILQLHPDKNHGCKQHAHDKTVYCTGCKKPDQTDE